MSFWFQGLNPEQQQAVAHNEGPLLILAGAGSGKTTVLVSRTGRLIAEKLSTPERICVLTFTNKAARELKHRVARKLGAHAEKVWAGTFHGFGLRFLKEHHEEAGLPKNFGVIDQGDAQAVLKDLLRDHSDYDKARLNLEELAERISYFRARGRDNTFDNSAESAASIVLAPKYMRKLRGLGVVDFEELLLRPLQMMRGSDEIRKKMQQRFDFMMVDEFQDTNHTQMEFVDELSGGHRNLAVVGDDDQSIYGWRGAEIQNILGFPKRYKGCRVIRLERNYRSTTAILNLANAIIANSATRHDKVLRPSLGSAGEAPELFVYENEEAEVDQVVREIAEFRKKDFRFKDIAILYRSNSQGGLMEGGLRRSRIPYRLSGGTALFDRKEAKDVMAFIRSCVFPTEISFRRIINLPARGVGDKTLDAIEALPGKQSFFAKAAIWAKDNPLEKGGEGLTQLFEFLNSLKNQLATGTGSAESILDSELRRIKYREYVNQSYRDAKAADARWISVTIIGRILDSMFAEDGRSLATVEKFIERMELRDLLDNDDPDADEVQMMTLHACKGLEFPLVFLLGLEEDLLPHARLGQNTDEERRLFYVGVTRAQKHLVMTRVEQRKRYGQMRPVAPSRFLLEIDAALIKEHRGGRPLVAGAREAMLAGLYAKLNKQIDSQKE